MERRERDRVQVSLECRMNCPGAREADLQCVTENISRSGMLIRCDGQQLASLGVGDVVTVRVKVPRNEVFGQRWMLFRAQVVRVGQAQDRSLFIAVAGSAVRFCSTQRTQAGEAYYGWIN